MFCYKCGNSMPDTDTVCPQCGAAAADAPQPAPQPTPPPATPYGVGPMQPPAFRPPTDGQATASLIFGILGLTCFWGIFGVPAVILGHIAKSNIRKSMGQLGGEGMAMAGLIMGYISIAFGLLIGFAIIVPNLHRARMEESANAARSTMRTLNTSQVIYATRYPNAGYAHNLATLGPGPGGVCSGEGNEVHACLVDSRLGCGATWCDKNGYSYNVTGADCASQEGCRDYVIVATPVAGRGNTRFCSTSDAILRSQTGGALATPPTPAECQSWTPI